MKLMLLTDIPPCSDLTAGLVLAKLCRFIPEGGVSCFTVLNKHLSPKLYADLDGMPLAITEKPNEFGRTSKTHPRLARLVSMVAETQRRHLQTPRLIDEAVSFGKSQGADAVLAVLQGQTMARIAKPVASRLGADLYTLVWDPMSWWLRAHHVDRLNRAAAQRDFDAAIRASKALAAASWAMAEEYQSRYGVRSTPVISSHDQSEAATPAETFRKPGELVIGMAGQFYSHEEWWQLIVALNHAGWRVGDRRVKLLVFSHEHPVGKIPPENLDYRGFAPQSNVVRALSNEADVLYCPYPFKREMEEVARLSFPSKLAMYLGCGRPVLFHGPSYSSPYKYLESRGAGVLCKDLDPPAVYNALCWLVEEPALYGRVTHAGMAAFRTDFTLDRMRASFFDFLGAGPEAFAQPGRAKANTTRHLPALVEGARRQRQCLAEHLAMLERAPPQPLPHPALAAEAASKLTAAVEANLALMAKAARLEEEKAGLVSRAAALHDELVAARLDLADTAWLQQAQHEAEQQIIALRQNIDSLQRDLSSARLELELRRHDLTGAHAELASVRRELQDARDREAELNQTIGAQAQTAEERAAALAEIRALREQIEAAREEHSLARVRAVGAEKKLEVIAASLEHVRQQNAALMAQRDAMRTQLDQAREAAALAEARALAAGEELQRARAEADGLTHSLQNNLDQTVRDRDQLIAQLRAHEQWLEQSQAAQASLQQNLDLTIADRDAVQARARVLSEQHAAIMVRYEELERLAENRIAALLGKMSNVERQIDADRWARLSQGKSGADAALRERYLDLVEAAITGTVFEDEPMSPWSKGYDPLVRSIGRDWPAHAVTMIGTARMRNLRHMVELTLREQVAGDYIETGVWRGGACIYIAAILAAHGDLKRKVWVADSFEGLPPPDPESYPADRGDQHHTVDELRVSLEEVQANFARFGLLSDRVKFLKGWFKDTLPAAPIERLAVLRLDGDMYSSTIEALDALYDKVSPGGVVIVDDYILPACKQAIDDFRARRGIVAPLVEVDGAAVYWRSEGKARRPRRAVTPAAE